MNYNKTPTIALLQKKRVGEIGLIDELIAHDNKLLFTVLSYVAVLFIFIDLSVTHFPLISFIASFFYFLINGTFLGYAFFKREERFLRLILGNLLLVMFLGMVGWLMMIAFNLDVVRSVIVLLIVATLSTLFKLKTRLAGMNLSHQNKIEAKVTLRLKALRLLYLVMVALSFYALFISRSGEVYTVWNSMHPLFVLAFIPTTVLLLVVIFYSERNGYKLFFVMIHSILIHSFFAIVFPAGDISAQALTLGRSRLVYENVSINGWPVSLPSTANLLSQIYYWFRGINFQTALSVILARMFNVDILLTHLWLVPILWGAFVPAAAFMVSRVITGSKDVSFLASLTVSLFPATIYYGAESVPNSLGFVFFLFSLYFVLSYLSAESRGSLRMAIAFSFFSLWAHYLTGIIAFSFLLLALALRKSYENEKARSRGMSRISFFVLFVFCASLLPLAFLYLKLFFPFYTYLSLSKLSELSLVDVISLFVFGEYTNFIIPAAFIHLISPLLGFFGIIYVLKKAPLGSFSRICSLFLLAGFMIYVIDYRILKLFMVNIPLNEERLWVLRDFVAFLFTAVVIYKIVAFLPKKIPQVFWEIGQRLSKRLSGLRLPTIAKPVLCVKSISIATYILIFISISLWVTASTYYGYPQIGPLQMTSYELEAAKFIDVSTNEKYVVVADPWFIYAGQMLVGVYNPRAFYFDPRDPKGVTLFLQMKNSVSPEFMIEAMKVNNATVAYFVVEKPRLGAEVYNGIIDRAQQNGLQTYQTLYYKGEEKLRIFRYKIVGS